MQTKIDPIFGKLVWAEGKWTTRILHYMFGENTELDIELFSPSGEITDRQKQAFHDYQCRIHEIEETIPVFLWESVNQDEKFEGCPGGKEIRVHTLYIHPDGEYGYICSMGDDGGIAIPLFGTD